VIRKAADQVFDHPANDDFISLNYGRAPSFIVRQHGFSPCFLIVFTILKGISH